MDFEYRSFSNQVYFGKGKIALLPDLLKDYNKIMVIGSKRMQTHVDVLINSFDEEKLIHFSNIVQHVPVALIEEAYEFLNKNNPDVLVAIGGGSAIGLAKALALETKLPIIAVPTTYSGSEQTNIWGKTSSKGKITGRSDLVLPVIVIYDTTLTIDMPRMLAVTSAMNAMAHLMEAIYASAGNPITQQFAILGMKEIVQGLKLLANQESISIDVNDKLLFGAYLGGKCLAEVPMSLHHKAAHVLGGHFGMDHASVHTVLQSYVLDYQWPYLNKDIQADFINILGEHPALKLKNLASDAGAKTDLKSIGFQSNDLDVAADLISSANFPNPAPITKKGILDLLTRAFEGIL